MGILEKGENSWCFFLLEGNGVRLPCASTDDHFPVMAATVNEDVTSHPVACLAGEAFRRVTLFG